MKFMTLFPVAFFAATVVAQEGYDFGGIATRGLDEEFAPSARAVREELVLRALNHVKQQAQDHADLVARTYSVLDKALFPRWGSGKYVIPDDTYHRDVKPKILQQMKSIKGFESKCGSNPDFHVERDGTVYPSSRKKNSVCTKP
ncbi:hypothetical protein C0989_011160 [Termitomyces sp. Mn162]|nr:hypothetical protein C0989_011160 [Termitomyces sp. Mn162]